MIIQSRIIPLTYQFVLQQAWGPLVRAYRFKHPILVQLSEKYSKSVPQILLRYSLQKVILMTKLLPPLFEILNFRLGIHTSSQVHVKGADNLQYTII